MATGEGIDSLTDRSHQLTSVFNFTQYNHDMNVCSCPAFLSIHLAATATSGRPNDTISRCCAYHKSMHIPRRTEVIHSLAHIEKVNGVTADSQPDGSSKSNVLRGNSGHVLYVVCSNAITTNEISLQFCLATRRIG